MDEIEVTREFDITYDLVSIEESLIGHTFPDGYIFWKMLRWDTYPKLQVNGVARLVYVSKKKYAEYDKSFDKIREGMAKFKAKTETLNRAS